MPQQQITAADIVALRNLYAANAKELVSQPFGSIDYKPNGTGSVQIPTGFLLSGIKAHVHLDVQVPANAQYSWVAEHAAIEELYLSYNGSVARIYSADSIFTSQLRAMEYPAGGEQANSIPPINPGTQQTLDFYYDIPLTYSLLSLLGVQNLNSKNIHASVGVRWGDIANAYTVSGATATGYIEFIAVRQSAPATAADGVPDLSKTYAVTYQDFPLTNSRNNKLVIESSDTITRLTLNFMLGGTGNGSDVASYDYQNSLQIQNVRFGWAELLTKYDAPYWYWQDQMAKRYGVAMGKWINRGTVVIDLDQDGGRNWVDASSVTDLAVTVDLGAAPPQGSKVRVTLETIVNTSPDIPIRA